MDVLVVVGDKSPCQLRGVAAGAAPRVVDTVELAVFAFAGDPLV